MAKDEKKAEESAEAPKKSKKLLLIIILVVVLAGGGGAYFMLGSASAEEPAPEPGEVLVLDATTMNLTDGHYLQLKLALQIIESPASAEIDGSKALDLAVDEFTYLKIADLSNEGRAKYKKSLKEKIIEAYEGDVMDIYFTDFVVQ